AANADDALDAIAAGEDGAAGEVGVEADVGAGGRRGGGGGEVARAGSRPPRDRRLGVLFRRRIGHRAAPSRPRCASTSSSQRRPVSSAGSAAVVAERSKPFSSRTTGTGAAANGAA